MQGILSRPNNRVYIGLRASFELPVACPQELTPEEFAACSSAVRPLLRGFTCRTVPGGLLLRETLQSIAGAASGIEGGPGDDRAAAAAVQPISAGLIPRGSSFELLIATSTGNTPGGGVGRGPGALRAPDMSVAVSKELARLFWSAPDPADKKDIGSGDGDSDSNSSSISSSSSDEDSDSSEEARAISDDDMVDVEGGADGRSTQPDVQSVGCRWGAVPLAVRSSLADLLHMALLVQASAAVDEGGGGGGGADALEALAAHRGLPSLPEGESTMEWHRQKAVPASYGHPCTIIRSLMADLCCVSLQACLPGLCPSRPHRQGPLRCPRLIRLRLTSSHLIWESGHLSLWMAAMGLQGALQPNGHSSSNRGRRPQRALHPGSSSSSSSPTSLSTSNLTPRLPRLGLRRPRRILPMARHLRSTCISSSMATPLSPLSSIHTSPLHPSGTALSLARHLPQQTRWPPTQPRQP